ncbi:MAG: ABC transporter permease [Chthonomonas sp.]|nr:ABC transporter permease [Chthonomonas sp.]
MFDRFEFLFSEAIHALTRKRWMSFASITTVTMALFLLGGLIYTVLSLQSSAAKLTERFEMRVFMQMENPEADTKRAQAVIATMPEVRGVAIKPRAQAWEEYKKKFPRIVEDLSNPLPDMLYVSLRDMRTAPEVSKRIQRLPGVMPNGVRYMDDARQFVSDGMRVLRWIGIALGVVMLITSGILIYNTIRMTVVARRREIRIMELVGASKSTIVTPMLIEGTIQGAIGGSMAGLLLYLSWFGFMRLSNDLTSQVNQSSFPVIPATLILCVLGATYGFLCSLFAMRDPKRIR